MRDPNRIHTICQALEEAWSKSPDQRLGQFLENYIFPGAILEGHRSVCLPFWQEDDETLEKLKRFKE